jgi:hypothetical protein
MSHCTEDDLILHYYGEHAADRSVERHLADCVECAAAYRVLEDTLRLIPADAVPDRDETYPLAVWQRLRGQLPEQEPRWWQGWVAWRPIAAGFAAAAIVIAAFVAGRLTPRDPERTPIATRVIEPASDERLRLAAIGDHLDQSERVLLDLVNAQGDSIDVSDQQMWAADLIDSNRFYRDAATRAGDLMVANVLDDLERSLLDVVHGPSTMTAAQLDDVRGRVDADALLFKVRVLADELHDRETPRPSARKTT